MYFRSQSIEDLRQGVLFSTPVSAGRAEKESHKIKSTRFHLPGSEEKFHIHMVSQIWSIFGSNCHPRTK